MTRKYWTTKSASMENENFSFSILADNRKALALFVVQYFLVIISCFLLEIVRVTMGGKNHFYATNVVCEGPLLKKTRYVGGPYR
jgi:hypothetical protein